MYKTGRQKEMQKRAEDIASDLTQDLRTKTDPNKHQHWQQQYDDSHVYKQPKNSSDTFSLLLTFTLSI